jgi:hypothetical protein
VLGAPYIVDNRCSDYAFSQGSSSLDLCNIVYLVPKSWQILHTPQCVLLVFPHPKQLAHDLFFLDPHGWALSDLDLQFDDVFVTAQPEAGAFVGFEGGNQIEHCLRILDHLACDGQ